MNVIEFEFNFFISVVCRASLDDRKSKYTSDQIIFEEIETLPWIYISGDRPWFLGVLADFQLTKIFRQDIWWPEKSLCTKLAQKVDDYSFLLDVVVSDRSFSWHNDCVIL